MTLKDVAKRLNRSEHTIRRYIQQGRLEAQLVDGKYDISEEALREYINAYTDIDIIHSDEETMHLKSQLEQMTTQMLKLQDELIETQRRADEAKQRSDTIIAQLTMQLNQLNERLDKHMKLLEYHSLPWWRRMFNVKKGRIQPDFA